MNPSTLDPRARLLVLLCFGALAVSIESWRGLLLITSLSVLGMIAVPALWRWKAFGLAIMITWGTIFSQALFHEDTGTTLFALGPLRFTQEGALHGAVQSLRLTSMSFAALALAASLPPDRVFAALRALRVPEGATLMLAASLRFIPDLWEAARVVRQALADRGQRVRVRHAGPLVARALRRAEMLADSLDKRGYDPSVRRVERRPLVWRPVDTVVATAAVGLAVFVGSARLAFTLYVLGVAYVPAWRPLYGFVRQWL